MLDNQSFALPEVDSKLTRFKKQRKATLLVPDLPKMKILNICRFDPSYFDAVKDLNAPFERTVYLILWLIF